MLDNNEKLLISRQFASEEYCKSEQQLRAKCSDSSFGFFTSENSGDINNCGDYIAFAVKKGRERIEKIFFSRQEACVIVVSATNILCKWIIGKKKSLGETATLLTNIRKMVSGEEYELADCQELAVFSTLKSFTMRKWCLLLVVDSFLQIIAG